MQEIDEVLARRLCVLTSEFYAANAASFSQTRQAPWRGWQHLLEVVIPLLSLGTQTPQTPQGAPQCQALCHTKVNGDLGKQYLLLAPTQQQGQLFTTKEESGELGVIGGRTAVGHAPINVLDIACGNLRFERFLASELLGRRLSCVVVDNSKDLVLSALSDDEFSPNPAFCELSFQSFDICDALAEDAVAQRLAAPESFADLAVSFGFMHHIPRFDWRVRLLRAMAAKTKPGGYVAVSCWCFMDDVRLASKAREITPAACERLNIGTLPENDYLLGWQSDASAVRYCHHFTDSELDELVAAVSDCLTLIARFEADGKNAPLNTYLVFQKSAF